MTQQYENSEVDMRFVMASMRRATLPIMLVAAVLAALVYFLLVSSPDEFTADGQVLLDQPKQNFATIGQNRQQNPLLPKEVLRSQISLLQSREYAIAVLSKLNLLNAPDLDPIADGIGFGLQLKMLLGISADLSKLERRERVILNYFKSVSVSLLADTQVLYVSATTEDADISAKLVNTLISHYLDNLNSLERAGIDASTQALEQQISDARQRISQAESEIVKYRAESRVFAAAQGAGKAQDEELSRLSNELLQARSRRVEQQARAERIEELLQSGTLDSASQIINSPAVTEIRQSLLQQKERRAQLLTTYLPAHPRVKAVSAQIKASNLTLREEMKKFARSFKIEADISLEKERKLDLALEALKDEISNVNVDQLKLEARVQDIGSQRRLLDSLLARQEDVIARERTKSGGINARQIVFAEPDLVPNPNFAGTGALVTFITVFMLGQGFVFLFAAMQSGGASSHSIQAQQMQRARPSQTQDDLQNGHSQRASRRDDTGLNTAKRDPIGGLFDNKSQPQLQPVPLPQPQAQAQPQAEPVPQPTHRHGFDNAESRQIQPQRQQAIPEATDHHSGFVNADDSSATDPLQPRPRAANPVNNKGVARQAQRQNKNVSEGSLKQRFNTKTIDPSSATKKPSSPEQKAQADGQPKERVKPKPSGEKQNEASNSRPTLPAYKAAPSSGDNLSLLEAALSSGDMGESNSSENTSEIVEFPQDASPKKPKRIAVKQKNSSHKVDELVSLALGKEETKTVEFEPSQRPAQQHKDRMIEAVYVDRISINDKLQRFADFRARMRTRRILITAQTDFLLAITAIEIARGCNQRGMRVCLVDSCMKPQLMNQQLGLSTTRGLADLLRGTAAVEDVLVADPGSGLAILPAGDIGGMGIQALQSQEMEDVIHQVESRFDLAVFCGPNMSVFSNYSRYVSSFEAVLLAAQVGQDAKQLDHHINTLKKLGKVNMPQPRSA